MYVRRERTRKHIGLDGWYVWYGMVCSTTSYQSHIHSHYCTFLHIVNESNQLDRSTVYYKTLEGVMREASLVLLLSRV